MGLYAEELNLVRTPLAKPQNLACSFSTVCFVIHKTTFWSLVFK